MIPSVTDWKQAKYIAYQEGLRSLLSRAQHFLPLREEGEPRDVVEIEARKIVGHIESPPPNGDARSHIQNLFIMIRSAVNAAKREQNYTTDSGVPIQPHIKSSTWALNILVTNLFRVSLYPFIHLAVQKAVGKRHLGELQPSQLQKSLEDLPQELRMPTATRKVQQASAVLGLSFDTPLSGNLPSALFAVAFNGHECALLHTGCPVISGIKGVSLSAEFDVFLRSEGKRLLYVNLQSLNRGTAPDERRSSALLREEFKTRQLESHLVTLNQSGPFAKQEGSFSIPQQKASDFFDAFLLQLTTSTDYALPSHMHEKGVKERFRTLMNEIHWDLYGRKPELTVQERRIFMDVFNAFFVLEEISRSKPKWVNLTCKYAADRGGKALYILHLLIHLLNGTESPEKAHQRYVMTFGMTCVTMKRTMNSVYERIVAVDTHLKTEKVKGRLKERGEKQWKGLLVNNVEGHITFW